MPIDEGLGLLSPTTDTRLKGAPDLRLLLELEPAPLVFLRNLSDVIFRRPLPPNPGTSKPGRYWTDVFVPTGLPWESFMESMLLHLALLSAIWAISQSWVRQEQIRREIEAHKSFISYYMPSKTFPTNRSSRPRERAHPKREVRPERQSPTRVAREHSNPEIKPPDVKLDRDRRPDSLASNSPSPRMPLFAPRLPQPVLPASPASVISPAPEVNQATARRTGLPPSAVVAPPPAVGSLISGRAVAAPNAAVIAPAPALRSATGKAGSISMGHVDAVAPSPGLSIREQANNSRTMHAGLGPAAEVVPPPQSINGTGGGGGRVSSGLVALVVPPPPSVAGTGSREGSALSTAQVVPPPQSIGGSAGVSTGRVRSGLVALVVPPPPSVQGAGRSGGSAQSNALPASQVVPPAPAVANAGVRNGSGIRASLSDASSQVVPPPQSIKGSGRGPGGRMSSDLGSQAVAPAPTVSGTGGSAARQASPLIATGAQPVPPPSADGISSNPGSPSTTAMQTNEPVTPPPPMENSSDPATIELPVRVIGLALALPTSSYFSNYEVFIAERRLKKGGSELIKLVSVSLPYQPRLSEYGINNSKVYKLHVTRDPSCDESLLQMTWPEANGPPPSPQYGTSTPAPAPGTGHDRLPCYRTTADEYWRALSGNR